MGSFFYFLDYQNILKNIEFDSKDASRSTGK